MDYFVAAIPDCRGSLSINVNQHVHSLVQVRYDRRLESAVVVVVHFRMFKEFFRSDSLREIIFGQEIVILTFALSGSG